MKKTSIALIGLSLFFFGAKANPVSKVTAQKVAGNFFNQVMPGVEKSVNLVYTETDSVNDPLFYVFNINESDGFVIISADNKLTPVIGYSTEKRTYAVPQEGTTVYYWMQKRKNEIIKDIANASLTATTDIANQWAAYLNNTGSSGSTSRITGMFPSNTAFLVQSTWDQMSPYYDDCPGTGPNRAVTGCVATTMCQIMRYWQYPVTGTGSSSYYAYGYGTLSAKYTHAYPWSSMALTGPSIADTNLPRAMSDAGISVRMSYSPTGSGSFVLTADDPFACAQISYVKYFKYYNKILDGLNEFKNQTAWADTLKHDLDRSRPIEYVGTDPVNGGHTWVCDGYDASNNFHMNWGWSGMDDGWYSLSNLNPAGMDFSQNLEALIGIMPPPVTAAPKAHFMVTSKVSCAGTAVQYIDTSSNQPNNWQWTFTGGSPSSSTLQDPTVSYSAPGKYAVKLVVKNMYGSDSITTTNYITVDSTPATPSVTHAGNLVSCVPNTYSHYQWFRNNSMLAGDTAWQFWVSQVGAYKVMVTNNVGCSSTSGNIEISVLGVNEVTNESGIKAYPNPNDGRFSIVVQKANAENGQAEIYNMLGKMIYSQKILGNNTLSFDLSNQPAGIYLFRVSSQSGEVIGEGKLVIK